MHRSMARGNLRRQLLPPLEYYLTPMNTVWAMTILRRAAEECKEREIRWAKLYETSKACRPSLANEWIW